ncbi:TAXI family TRAP transporter solute-binding subunit [Mariniblastus sp.]|nr:TAXI family TRAP transporter solute-binding subunit [Mariniblastus sp.]
MQRSSLILLALAVTFVGIFGCAEKGEYITLGTGTPGGTFVTVGNAIATTVEGNKGDLDWRVGAKETKGTQENIRNLESGSLQFAMANAAISYFASRGEGNWKKKHDIFAVATLAPNVGVFVTTEGTGIKTIADLKGKRVVLGPAGAGFEYFLEPLLEAHGVKYSDMKVLNGNYLAAQNMIADGKADVAFMGGAIPISALSSLCSSQDVVFIKFDESAVEKLKEYPFYYNVPIPASKYDDLKEDMMGINVGNMQLLSHAKVPEDVVYNFTKIMYENRDAIAQQHPAGKALNPKNIIRDTGTPFHPGAIKFYKEAGIWPKDAADASDEKTEEPVKAATAPDETDK